MSSAIARSPRSAKWLAAQQVFEPTSRTLSPGAERDRRQQLVHRARLHVPVAVLEVGQPPHQLAVPAARCACARRSARARRPRRGCAAGGSYSSSGTPRWTANSLPHARQRSVPSRTSRSSLASRTARACARRRQAGQRSCATNSAFTVARRRLGAPQRALRCRRRRRARAPRGSIRPRPRRPPPGTPRARRSAAPTRSPAPSRSPAAPRRSRSSGSLEQPRAARRETDAALGLGHQAVLAVDAEVAVAVGVGADDRAAGRHRLQRRQREALVRGGLHEHGGLVEAAR